MAERGADFRGTLGLVVTQAFLGTLGSQVGAEFRGLYLTPDKPDLRDQLLGDRPGQGLRTRGPYRGSGLAMRRPLYSPTYGDRSGSWNRARRRGPWIAGAYGYGYPGWGGYPYPYVIDPGFYDWGDSGDSDYGSGYAGGANQGYADLVPYPSSGDASEPPGTHQHMATIFTGATSVCGIDCHL